MTAGGQELIWLGSHESGWLADYAGALASTALGDVSREVILEDSRFIGDRAALATTDPGWGASQVRTGVVMGAVQSGKTASMIGVIARSLDIGVNVVVVLAGTQVSLWRQSMTRIQAQLDCGPNPLRRRLFLPNPDDLAMSRRPGPTTAYNLPAQLASRVLTQGRPIIFVAMKQSDHLLHLGQVLHKVVFPAAERAGVPARLLVVDDEADDSSVADDGAQWGSAALDVFKETPRRIIDLWEDRNRPGRTTSNNVFATYLAYTATPQANFLQDPQNPLSPRDFVAALRTPGAEGSVRPRSLTYRVPGGLRDWYTGADVFYGPLSPMLCVASDGVEPEDVDSQAGTDSGVTEASLRTVDVADLVDATRAYVVAAAIRLSRTSGRVGPGSARTITFESREDAETRIAPVCSMLVHPSSALEQHFEAAKALRGWWDGRDGEPGSGIIADLDENGSAWEQWVDRFRESSDAVRQTYEVPGSSPDDRSVPGWEALRSLVVNEVVPGTSIAVINSDPNADERPSFSPWQDADGWHAPRNHSTIYVSGNVMSRGLTLEGLLTTLFTRRSTAPLADTQMQMQRWFGYRGSYIDLCRVFLSSQQLELFTRYGETDHALRAQVLAATESTGKLPDFMVLQGQTFRATGKVADLAGRQLRPGSRPFVRHLNPPGEDLDNLAVVGGHFAAALASGQLVVDPRGLLSLGDLSLLECAALLDQLRYTDHGALPFEQARWHALEVQAKASPEDPAFPLYRAPRLSDPGLDLGSRSPFVIAAYLRFWAACLDHDISGVLTDDSPPQRWSLLNRQFKISSQPRFRVGVRFGSGPPVSVGPFAELSKSLGLDIRPMARATSLGDLAADWGSRKATGTGYVGDDLFDASLLSETLPLHADGTRAEGAPGLVLFHLVQRAESGGIAVGLSIPHGGPDHVEALSAIRRGEAGIHAG